MTLIRGKQETDGWQAGIDGRQDVVVDLHHYDPDLLQRRAESTNDP